MRSPAKIKVMVFQIAHIVVSTSWIRRLIKMWDFTTLVPQSRNIHKYSVTNLLRWITFYSWIQTLDPAMICYIDEVHFEPKSLRQRRGYAPKGSRIIHVSDEYINERYSMILMTVPGGSPQPFQARIFKETIDSEKFVLFLAHAIATGALKSGNWLVMDNAATHFSKDTYEIMMAMLEGAGVKLVFLPTYSPEFNPCELIFGLIKNWIRNNRGQGKSLLDEIKLGIDSVQDRHVVAFYYHCIYEAEP